MADNLTKTENQPYSEPDETVYYEWETWELPPAERSARWYLISGIIGLSLIVYGLFTANFIFSIIVILFAVIIMLRDVRKPEKVTAGISSSGVVLGATVYPFKDIQDFSISYEPPTIKMLYITFNGRLHPMLSIPIEDANPNDIRAALLPFVFENLNREGETLTDILRRVYKL